MTLPAAQQAPSEPSPQRILFHYIHDTKTKRVLTIARTVKKDASGSTVSFGLAMNRPARYDELSQTFVILDQFDKRLGRKIATGRLSTKPYTVPVDYQSGQKPLECILAFLSSNDTTKQLPENGKRYIQRMARHELVRFAQEEAIRSIQRSSKQEPLMNIFTFPKQS